MTIDLTHILGIMGAMLGITLIPWTVFVTVSIFGLKQQIALLKQEIHLLNKISNALSKLDVFKTAED